MSVGFFFEGTVEQAGTVDSAAVHLGIGTPQDLVVAAGGVLSIDGQLDMMADEGHHLTNNGTVRVPGWLNMAPRTGNMIAMTGSGTLVLEGGTIAAFALDLPRAAEVSLRVYDIAGRDVASLSRGVREAGVHQFALRGHSLASGVYFGRVQLRSEGRTETRTAPIVYVK